MWKTIARATLLTVAIGATPCFGGFDFKDYEKLKTMPWFTRWIGGVGSGFEVANAALRNRGMPSLYCPPPTLALGEEDYRDILARHIASVRSYTGDMPVETILLQALREAFPCTEAVTSQTVPQFEPLRFESTIWDPQAQTNRGCLGQLEISADQLIWHDTTNCWRGPDIRAHLANIEWISYDRINGQIQATATVKFRDGGFAQFRLPGTTSIKLIRLLNAVSASTRQHCLETTLQLNASHDVDKSQTPVFCTTWLNEH